MTGPIVQIETIPYQLPMKRVHELANAQMKHRTFLLVRITTDSGQVGIGEVTLPGGPWWTGDTIEGCKHLIDQYFTPKLLERDPFMINDLLRIMDIAAFGNMPAKAGVEMALLDLKAKALNVPLYELLGGRTKQSLPVTWALGSDRVEDEIDEAEEKVASGFCSRLKIKMGFLTPEKDVKRVTAIAKAMADKASLLVDLNATWDEFTALKYLPQLIEAGVSLIEQPLERTHIKGLARLARQLSVPIILDESVCTLRDVNEASQQDSPFVFSLKLMKSGGLYACAKIASIAESAHIPCYGGSFLESSIGAAANLQLASAVDFSTYGGEWVGPQLLADEVVTTPMEPVNGYFEIPDSPGIGVKIDEEKLDHYRQTASGKLSIAPT